MTVRHEVKGQLAKLLATEDLIVESKKVDTACFNVHTRVLTLPMWDKASNNVYDALVGHEVGHALFTPDSNWFEEIDIPMGIVNCRGCSHRKDDEEKVCRTIKDFLLRLS